MTEKQGMIFSFFLGDEMVRVALFNADDETEYSDEEIEEEEGGDSEPRQKRHQVWRRGGR